MDIEKKKIKGGCKIVQVHDMERILLAEASPRNSLAKSFVICVKAPV
jgi:hypothetical protein